MSLLLDKRRNLRLIETALEEIYSKRFKFGNNASDREIVYFSSSSLEENLNRLCLLFPTMKNKKLLQCLKSTNNNIEGAIKQIQELSTENQKLSRKCAKTLVQSLENSRKEEAVDIAINIFNQFYKEISLKEKKNEKTINNQNYSLERIKERTKKIIHDNYNLKQTVAKLKEKTENMDNFERENFYLRNEVDRLNLINCILRLHHQSSLEESNHNPKENPMLLD